MEKQTAEIKFSLTENAMKSNAVFYPISISVINPRCRANLSRGKGIQKQGNRKL